MFCGVDCVQLLPINFPSERAFKTPKMLEVRELGERRLKYILLLKNVIYHQLKGKSRARSLLQAGNEQCTWVRTRLTLMGVREPGTASSAGHSPALMLPRNARLEGSSMRLGGPGA